MKKLNQGIRRVDTITWNPIIDTYAPWESPIVKEKRPKITQAEIDIIMEHQDKALWQIRDILRAAGYNRSPEKISKVRRQTTID